VAYSYNPRTDVFVDAERVDVVSVSHHRDFRGEFRAILDLEARHLILGGFYASQGLWSVVQGPVKPREMEVLINA
jgi:hypothetical protein